MATWPLESSGSIRCCNPPASLCRVNLSLVGLACGLTSWAFIFDKYELTRRMWCNATIETATVYFAYGIGLEWPPRSILQKRYPDQLEVEWIQAPMHPN